MCWDSDHSVTSVVVDNLYIFGACRSPAKTDSELIVDSDAMLTLSLPLQGLKAVARRNTQILLIGPPLWYHLLC